MIPLYILGLLLRFGPQHGYQIKKTIAGQLSDFTQIKLPTIYYHLEKMRLDGLLNAEKEKESSRPEKTVYAVTQKGREAFNKKLKALLKFEYRPVFALDAVFYFSEYLDPNEIAVYLQAYVQKLMQTVSGIEKHKAETLVFVPEEMHAMVCVIFSHHLLHYRAELEWANESLKLIKGEKQL